LQAELSGYPDEITQYYLQVPHMADRVYALAHQIGTQQATVYDTVLAVQTYLMQNYAYSLSVSRSTDVPLLEDFLFVNRAGHCEFYATGMAILLRILGIPARVVNGFARGRWNEYGHFFTVRQSDAHSWVEVYFPSYGWVEFDPTPEAAFGETYQEFVEKESLLASLYRYSEYLRVRWNRYVVDYDREDQAEALFRAYISTRSARRNFRSWLSQQKSRLERLTRLFSWRNILRVAGVLLGGLLAGYLIFRILSRWHIRIPWPAWRFRKRAGRKQIVRFYHRMRRILAHKGISLTSSATPGEFSRYVAQEYATYAQGVDDLTRLYYAVRYGHAELTPEQFGQITQTLRAIKNQKG
jgi:transglutaminase-like putative cysteine protease